MTAKPEGAGKPRAYSEVLGNAIKALTDPPCSHLTTGLRDLDSVLEGGLPIGALSAVAGRPSMGRSQFARNVALSVARAGDGVLYFSAEDPECAIAWHGLAEVLDVDMGFLRRPSDRQEMLALLSKRDPEVTKLAGLPMTIDDTPSLTPRELHDRVAEWCRSGVANQALPRLVVIDSVACLFPASDPTFVLVKPVMEMLADLARRESIHILCTVPVSAHVDQRESRYPRLFDLWGEGAVERYCDTVIALYRDSYYIPPSEEEATDDAQVLVLRSTAQGITGVVNVSFLLGRFSDLQT